MPRSFEMQVFKWRGFMRPNVRKNNSGFKPPEKRIK